MEVGVGVVGGCVLVVRWCMHACVFWDSARPRLAGHGGFKRRLS